MFNEAWVDIAIQKFLDMFLGVEKNCFQTWECQLCCLFDIVGYTLDVRVGYVDLAWSIRGSVGGMNCSQGLRDFVKKTIVPINLFPDLLTLV
jgi:hypothetical protein